MFFFFFFFFSSTENLVLTLPLTFSVLILFPHHNISHYLPSVSHLSFAISIVPPHIHSSLRLLTHTHTHTCSVMQEQVGVCAILKNNFSIFINWKSAFPEGISLNHFHPVCTHACDLCDISPFPNPQCYSVFNTSWCSSLFSPLHLLSSESPGLLIFILRLLSPFFPPDWPNFLWNLNRVET